MMPGPQLDAHSDCAAELRRLGGPRVLAGSERRPCFDKRSHAADRNAVYQEYRPFPRADPALECGLAGAVRRIDLPLQYEVAVHGIHLERKRAGQGGLETSARRWDCGCRGT